MLRNFANLTSHDVLINLVSDTSTNTWDLQKFSAIRYFKWKFANCFRCVLVSRRLVIVFFYIGKHFQLISDVFIGIKSLIFLDLPSFEKFIHFSNDTLSNTRKVGKLFAVLHLEVKAVDGIGSLFIDSSLEFIFFLICKFVESICEFRIVTNKEVFVIVTIIRRDSFVLKKGFFFFTLLKALLEIGVLLFKVGDVGGNRLRVHV